MYGNPAATRQVQREDYSCAIRTSTCTPLSLCSQCRNDGCGIGDADCRTNLRPELVWVRRDHAETASARRAYPDQDSTCRSELCGSGQGGSCPAGDKNGSCVHQN